MNEKLIQRAILLGVVSILIGLLGGQYSLMTICAGLFGRLGSTFLILGLALLGGVLYKRSNRITEYPKTARAPASLRRRLCIY
jgi:hypothetical protein